MKVDLEQEKFLKRLDLRISTLCSVMSYCEKIVSRSFTKDRKEQRIWDKNTDEFHREILKNIEKFDNEIVKYFDKMERNLKELQE